MDTLADILENLIHYITPRKKDVPKTPQHLVLERLIDAGDDKTKRVCVGIAGGDQHQVIRVGEYPEPVHALRSFVRADGEFKYTFEDDISLTLKNSSGEITYTLRTPQFTQQNVMRVPYKTISMGSKELDVIAELK
jgi:hypothetical protein